MDFIKQMYEEDLVEKHLDEDAWDRIKDRQLDKVSREKQIALYGYLVGIDNAAKAIKAIQYAEEGKGIPQYFVKAYWPIIEMIDDFINAGPGAVSRLKQVHRSIKKKV
jgi:hypothetical protein